MWEWGMAAMIRPAPSFRIDDPGPGELTCTFPHSGQWLGEDTGQASWFRGHAVSLPLRVLPCTPVALLLRLCSLCFSTWCTCLFSGLDPPAAAAISPPPFPGCPLPTWLPSLPQGSPLSKDFQAPTCPDIHALLLHLCVVRAWRQMHLLLSSDCAPPHCGSPASLSSQADKNSPSITVLSWELIKLSMVLSIWQMVLSIWSMVLSVW